jgi:hypothetical protein
MDFLLRVSPARRRDRLLQSSVVDFLAADPSLSILNLRIREKNGTYKVMYDAKTSFENAMRRMFR